MDGFGGGLGVRSEVFEVREEGGPKRGERHGEGGYGGC